MTKLGFTRSMISGLLSPSGLTLNFQRFCGKVEHNPEIFMNNEKCLATGFSLWKLKQKNTPGFSPENWWAKARLHCGFTPVHTLKRAVIYFALKVFLPFRKQNKEVAL